MEDEYEFNPEDHGIELDEIAKMHAERDMEEDRKEWLREQANRFYADFATLNIPNAVKAVMALIRAGELSRDRSPTRPPWPIGPRFSDV